MQKHKEQKTEELFKKLAAEFLQRESSGSSLITVTAVQISDRFSKALILISVFPDHKQDQALDFARRKRTEFREYVKERAKMRKLPAIDFAIDFGEKNRQLIDTLSENK
jgi:ribosome-binding factor A